MNRNLKVLQINSVNFGSTGNIMLNISKISKEYGQKPYVAYANSRSNKKKNVENAILIGSILERNMHLKLAYYTGLNGCFSWHGTKKFLSQVEILKPDIIHLHNLHNCYINLEILFNYIKEKDIPVIWTLHDCWAFTGQCPHFAIVKCDKWKDGCFNCPQYNDYPASKVDKTKKMYNLKRKWFTGVKHLTIVTPSQWLSDRVKESFLEEYPVKVINNGINLSVFKPTDSDFREKFNLNGKKILLGVANPWNERKGLFVFLELAKKISNDYKIVLVGLSPEQIEKLPLNILGFPNINDINQLASIYSAADYFINPSLEETMGLVTLEALACGTPAIVSNSTAVPEMVNLDCGLVVKENSSDGFFEAITTISRKFKQEDLLNWAREFEMGSKYKEYINLYNSLGICRNG